MLFKCLLIDRIYSINRCIFINFSWFRNCERYWTCSIQFVFECSWAARRVHALIKKFWICVYWSYGCVEWYVWRNSVHRFSMSVKKSLLYGGRIGKTLMEIQWKSAFIRAGFWLNTICAQWSCDMECISHNLQPQSIENSTLSTRVRFSQLHSVHSSCNK